MVFTVVVNRFTWIVPVIAVSLFAVATMGAEKAKEAPKEEKKPAAKEEAAKPPADNRYAVPEGGVDELVKFIEKLEAFRPNNARDDFAYRQKAPAALRAAADKILELEKGKESEASKKASGVLLQLDVRRIAQAEEDEQREILGKLTDYLSAKQLARGDIGLAFNVGRALEYADAQEVAAEAYEAFGKIFSDSTDEQLSSFGEMSSGSARRLRLVGNVLELKGTKLDGTKFDVAELKDKVVLVDFWATWCGPCRVEFPNIKKAYEKYHEHGLEVVGVSIDQDRKSVEDYVEKQEVPWITLHEKDDAGKNPATKRYGIFGIPAMFLIGKDGKVVSITARGNELPRLLEEQFGDIEATDDAES